MKVYDKIIKLFQESKIVYHEKTHSAEGYGTNVAQIHGLDERFGAKAMVVELKKKPQSYCLVILPFDCSVDTKKLQEVLGAKISFAKADISEKLTECVPGSIPPFSFDYNELPMIVDNGIKANPKLFFNIGKLESSVSIDTTDYLKLVESYATFANVSKPKSPAPVSFFGEENKINNLNPEPSTHTNTMKT